MYPFHVPYKYFQPTAGKRAKVLYILKTASIRNISVSSPLSLNAFTNWPSTSLMSPTLPHIIFFIKKNYFFVFYYYQLWILVNLQPQIYDQIWLGKYVSNWISQESVTFAKFIQVELLIILTKIIIFHKKPAITRVYGVSSKIPQNFEMFDIEKS